MIELKVLDTRIHCARVWLSSLSILTIWESISLGRLGVVGGGGEAGREGRESDLSVLDLAVLAFLFLVTYNQLRYLSKWCEGGLTGMLVSVRLILIGMIREEGDEVKRSKGFSPEVIYAQTFYHHRHRH